MHITESKENVKVRYHMDETICSLHHLAVNVYFFQWEAQTCVQS